MTIDKELIDRLKARGEEMFTQVSAELMQNPRFMKAMEGAMKGKERVDDLVRQALKKASIPTRTEFKKAVARIDSLEDELAALRKKVEAASRPKAAKRSRSVKTAPKKAPKKKG